jgi:hypothetical protein
MAEGNSFKVSCIVHCFKKARCLLGSCRCCCTDIYAYKTTDL